MQSTFKIQGHIRQQPPKALWIIRHPRSRGRHFDLSHRKNISYDSTGCEPASRALPSERSDETKKSNLLFKLCFVQKKNGGHKTQSQFIKMKWSDYTPNQSGYWLFKTSKFNYSDWRFPPLWLPAFSCIMVTHQGEKKWGEDSVVYFWTVNAFLFFKS